MAIQVQMRGGTSEEHKTFIGAPREISIDTDKNTVVVHDGKTPGGSPLSTEKAFTEYQKVIDARLKEFESNVGKTHNHDDLYAPLVHHHDDRYARVPVGAKGAFYKSDGNYDGLVSSTGSAVSAIRTPANGLLPYQSGGYSDIGASTWRFANGFFNTIDIETLKFWGQTTFTGKTLSSYADDYSYYIIGDMMIAYGSTMFTKLSANTSKTLEVVFPKKFNIVPVVMAIPNTSVPQTATVAVTDIRVNAFKLSLYKTNTSDTNVFWFAFGSAY